MRILEDMYGRMDPYERFPIPDPRMKNLRALVIQNSEKLWSTLTDEQREQFEKYNEAEDEMTELLACKAFAHGFCIAVKIMCEVMGTMDVPSVDD